MSTKRQSADITRKSAVNIAKWRIGDLLKTDASLGAMQKMALRMALSEGGAVEQIADILYDCGLKLSVDMNNPEHQSWIKKNEKGVASVYLEQES